MHSYLGGRLDLIIAAASPNIYNENIVNVTINVYRVYERISWQDLLYFLRE